MQEFFGGIEKAQALTDQEVVENYNKTPLPLAPAPACTQASPICGAPFPETDRRHDTGTGYGLSASSCAMQLPLA
eukprot:8436299-Pyramimonas_sp.AAC.1